MKKYTCHVCGYPELSDPPWGDDGKSSSFDICPCCGVEYGYEDAREAAMLKFRQQWIASGGKWFNERLKPRDWDMKKQLLNIQINL